MTSEPRQVAEKQSASKLAHSQSRRIRLDIAYDGTDFSGWATQVGERTVCQTLEDTIKKVSGQTIELYGSSRTDSGTHARGQVAHFDTDVNIEPTKWAEILNRAMPEDLCIVASKQVKDDFHARFSVRDRYYRYRIRTAGRDPLQSRFVHNYGYPLNVEKMQEAAKFFIGDHDFLAFTEEVDPASNTRRILFDVQVKQTREEVWIDIVGTAFLRGMMRRMSGGLLEVGWGKRPVEDIAKLLTEEREAIQWPVVLPAKGLCLMKINFGRHPRDNRKTNL